MTATSTRRARHTQVLFTVLTVLWSTLLLFTTPSSSAITSSTPRVTGFSFISNSCANTTCLNIRVFGLSNNLVLNTNYNAQVSSGGTPPWTFNITNLDTGNYAVSDNNGTTFTPISTDCLNPDLPTISLDLNSTNTNTFSASSRLRMRLTFLENFRYRLITYRFNNGAANCNSSITNTSTDGYQVWTRTANDLSACTTPKTVLEQDFNFALQRCGFTRDESNAAATVFSGRIIITTTDTGVVIRNQQYERMLETGVDLTFSFPTAVTAQTNASVFGPRITASAISSQTWDPATFTASIVLLTSVQWPYQLKTPLLSSSLPSDWSLFTPSANPQDSGADYDGDSASVRSQCYNPGGSTPATSPAYVAGNICQQFWTVTLRRSALCTTGATVTLAGSWVMNFTVTCVNQFTGACTGRFPSNDSITFTTSSGNYCPVLLSTVSTSAVLNVYRDVLRTVSQTQFVFGTTSYFEVEVTAPILMSNVGIESIYLLSGGTLNSTTPLFSRPFSTSNVWFAQSSSTGTFGSFGGVQYNSATVALSVTDNADGSSSAFVKRARFSWIWHSSISTANTDAAVATTIQVNLRLRYTNQSIVSLPIRLHNSVLFSSPRPRLVAEQPESVSTTTIVRIKAFNTLAAVPDSSDAGAITIFAITIISCVVALVSLSVALFFVYLRRRNHKLAFQRANASTISLPGTSGVSGAAAPVLLSSVKNAELAEQIAQNPAGVHIINQSLFENHSPSQIEVVPVGSGMSSQQSQTDDTTSQTDGGEGVELSQMRSASMTEEVSVSIPMAPSPRMKNRVVASRMLVRRPSRGSIPDFEQLMKEQNEDEAVAEEQRETEEELRRQSTSMNQDQYSQHDMTSQNEAGSLLEESQATKEQRPIL